MTLRETTLEGYAIVTRRLADPNNRQLDEF
jgi:hypothetical protein